MKRLALILTLVIATAAAAQTDARVERILREVPIIDGHNDLPDQFRDRVKNHLAQLDLRQDQSKLAKPLHTDIPRLRAGHVGGQFWSVYVPATVKGTDALRNTLEQIDVVHRLAEQYPDTFAIALTSDDITRIQKSGRIASLIGMEGGHSIANSLGALRATYAAGARYMTLTHSLNNDWADSGTDDPKFDGLSPFGKEVVREMNRMGMLVDLSHTSPATMHDVLDIAEAPPIFSHSSARAVTNHARNVPDDVLKRINEKDGIVMITFVPGFVSETVRTWGSAQVAEEARLKDLYRGQPAKVKELLAAWETAHPKAVATISDVADHVEQVMRVAGVDHVGIGGDFDGITSTPEGLASVADYPKLIAELLRRGHTDEEMKKLAGLNLLRVMRKVETAAAKLQKERPASDALLEEMK